MPPVGAAQVIELSCGDTVAVYSEAQACACHCGLLSDSVVLYFHVLIPLSRNLPRLCRRLIAVMWGLLLACLSEPVVRRWSASVGSTGQTYYWRLSRCSEEGLCNLDKPLMSATLDRPQDVVRELRPAVTMEQLKMIFRAVNGYSMENTELLESNQWCGRSHQCYIIAYSCRW
jgi:hypothetical protein